MKHIGLLLLALTALLSLNALYLNYSQIYLKLGRIDFVYLAFSVLGLLGSVLSLAKLKLGKWVVLVFYILQVVFIYGDGWRFVLHPGFEISQKFLKGNIDTALVNPVGFGVNIFAAIMCVLVFNFVDRNPRNNNPRHDHPKPLRDAQPGVWTHKR